MSQKPKTDEPKKVGAVASVIVAGITAQPPSNSEPVGCKRCGKPPMASGYCQTCQRVKDGIADIPPFYRSLKPIKPVSFDEGKPFVVLLPTKSGECGQGKSITACDLLVRTAWADLIAPHWVNCAELLMEIRASFSGRGLSEKDIVEKYAKRHLLCLDDLAAEQVTDFSVTTLYIILNRRGEYGLKTIVTSNLTLNDMKNTLGSRVADRLARYGKVIAISSNNVQKA